MAEPAGTSPQRPPAVQAVGANQGAVEQPRNVHEGHEHARCFVMVVDDEPAIARLIVLTLEDAGFHVEYAPDGASALGAIEQSPPQLVVLDLQLPDMDGREVYRRVRSSGYDMPIVIISAYGARRAQRELGAAAAIEKPFDPQVVRNRVEALLCGPAS